MTIKKASKTRSAVPAEVEPDLAKKFVSAESKKRFEEEIKERKVSEEKGFILGKGKDFGLPAEVANIIRIHKWRTLAAHPSNPILPLVREFYSNIITPDQTFSMVRGVKVSFSAPSINLHFNLEDFDDKFSDMLDSVGGEELEKVLKSVSIEGTNWLPNRGQGIYICARPNLKPLAKVWYHFIRTRLMPTTHIETVNRERMLLLYCILEGYSINVGKVVQREILSCNLKQKGCLFFSSLISELCVRAGVDIRSTDEVLANTAAISTTAIKRFFQSAPKPQQDQQPGPSSNQDLVSSVKQLEDLVRHSLDQQQKFWTFEKDAHMWMKRMFQLNFPKKLLNSPVFPDDILLPFVIPTVEHAGPSQAVGQTEPCDEQEEAVPMPQPPRTRTKAKASRKGKEVVPEAPNSSSESWLNRVSAESDSTPTPPPKKRTKVAASPATKKAKAAASTLQGKQAISITPVKKKRSQLVAAEIAHYYSSTDSDNLTVSTLTKKKSQASGKKVASAPPAPVDDDDDLEVVKEVQHTAARTLRQMAEAAKRRPGLRRNA